jgi:hypothetical protein
MRQKVDEIDSKKEERTLLFIQCLALTEQGRGSIVTNFRIEELFEFPVSKILFSIIRFLKNKEKQIVAAFRQNKHFLSPLL